MWELSSCISPTKVIAEAVDTYASPHLHTHVWEPWGLECCCKGTFWLLRYRWTLQHLAGCGGADEEGPQGSRFPLSDLHWWSWEVGQAPSYCQNSTFGRKPPLCLSCQAVSSRGMQPSCCCQRRVGIIISLIFMESPGSHKR